MDPRTLLVWPMIEDHPDWSTLRAMGLDTHDAHHLMVAIRANCDVFLTCDKNDFCPRRTRIKQEYPQIQILWPSEALYHL
jgi:predicted nucleic acid-binding protein